MTPTKLTETPALLGEGPCWHEAEQVLYWVDILGKALHRYDPVSKKDRQWAFDEMVGTVAPRKAGGLLLGLEFGFGVFDPETESLEKLPHIELGPNTRFNDGKCDPQGRFWCGSMDRHEKESIGSLYRMDRDGTVSAQVSGVGVSNGMTWSPDRKVMYYIDSPTRCVFAYDFDAESGVIANRRTAFQLDESEGFPDGMTSDQNGMLWLAQWGGARVTQRDPMNGRVLETISLPALQTSACCFGGPDLSDLYITSARVNLSAAQLAEYPESGHLFHVSLTTSGESTFTFG